MLRIGAEINMSIEITITQKGFFKKVLPFEVIVGSELKYGSFDGIRLEDGTIGADEFIAYNPNHIARGFSVTWKDGEKQQVYLRLLIPSHDAEIDDFYNTITRIATYWKNCKINQDGEPITLNDINYQRSNMKAFSLRTLNDICNETKVATEDEDGKVLFVTDDTKDNGELISPYEGEITLYGARWPIVLGEKEKTMLADSADSTEFKKFLHEKQAIDAYYAKALFYEHNDTKELCARYVLTEDTVSIFPRNPTVPWWMVDEQTGEPIKIENWEIGLCSITKNDLIGEIPYDNFIAKLQNVEYYDHGHVLIQGVSLAEMKELLIVG